MYGGKEAAPKSMKVQLKGGAYVDPESGLDQKAHVVKVRDALFSVVLGAVNIQEGKNSYYKLQLLKHDKKEKYGTFGNSLCSCECMKCY